MERKDNRKFYDEAFLEIFANRKIVRSLLRDFIHEEWVGLIDFSTMQTEKTVFKGIGETKKASDLLLKFNLKETAPLMENTTRGLSVSILIEFQSTPQRILLRVFEYLLRIYKMQLKENSIFHPVVPIVIYNGKGRWIEKRNLKDYFIQLHGSLLKYLPLFEYILIDVLRFDDTLLVELQGAASFFFLLDKTDLTQRERAEKRIIGILKKLIHSDPEIYNLLGRYISELLRYKGVAIPEINDYINERGESMLAQSMDKLFEQGIEQGIEQGELRDKQTVLIRLAEKKFGISAEEKALVLSISDPGKLDSALDEIIFVDTFAAVQLKLKE
jgi:hypothetical protein